MNGYEMMAKSCKTLMEKGEISKEQAEAEIRIYEFLTTCSKEDKFRLVDSSAFNDIIGGYLEILIDNSDISTADKRRMKQDAGRLVGGVTARDAYNKWYGKNEE